MRDWFAQDLRYSVRALRRAPAFTGAVIAILALGIGVNAAIFCIVDAVLLRRVPVRAPQELYFLAHGIADPPSLSSTYPLLSRYHALRDVFSGVTAYNVREFRVSTAAGLEPVAGQYVAGNYHHVLGVPFVLGRGFADEADVPSERSFICVISEGYWERAYGRDKNVLGKTLTVQNKTVTIVGVTAAGFHGLRPGTRLDITLPLALRVLDDPGFPERHDTWTGLNIVARLSSGVSEAQALTRVDDVFGGYVSLPEQAWILRRGGSTQDSFRSARLVPAGRGTWGLRTTYDKALRVLSAMVALVLTIVCANVAHLLLVRGSGRAKELAIRISLGATRGRLVRQTLTECLILAGCGGILGVLLAAWGATAIVSMFRVGQLPVMLDVELNGTVVTFTAAVTLVTSILVGVLPALRGGSRDVTPALKTTATHSGGRRRVSLASALTIGQVATAILLVAATGALVRTLHTLKSSDSGFQKSDVLLFYVDTTGSTADGGQVLQPGLLQRLQTLSGARAVSLSTASPLATDEESRPFSFPGLTREGEQRPILTNRVSPDYFRVFGIQVLRGRAFTDGDAAAAPQVAMVSETAARVLFHGSDPVGRTFAFTAAPRQQVTIVGVVRDVQQQSLRAPSPPLVYVPLAQSDEAPSLLTAAIRTAQRPRSLEREARAAVASYDSSLLVSYVRTLEEQIAASLVRERVMAWLSTGFGLVALVLACAGVYGVLAHAVARRTREIGIRIALGAAPGAVLRRTMREAMMLCGIGALIGAGATSLAAPTLAGFVQGSSPRDSLTLLMATAALLASGLAAAYLPARRAARVHPIEALRTE